MDLRNNFTDEQKSLWAFDYFCHAPGEHNGICASNQGVSIHHVWGRSSNSTLNSIPLCDECHRNYTFLDKSDLLKTTIKHLVKIGYEFTKNDAMFYQKYKNFYK